MMILDGLLRESPILSKYISITSCASMLSLYQSKMAVMHKGNKLYKTRNCNAQACKKNSHVHVNSFSRAHKYFLCACKSLFFIIII